ncbi:hypothetical protein X797_008271 [Metarhizium robertsii]|uniref:Uncharacterized protein n=1 Tax=Metarhizium robertsii TaxID=568076 RepID=A0A014N0G2_9HYPO|nr:hypothetical protein X797_008271 [Metarhizium robertsii]
MYGEGIELTMHHALMAVTLCPLLQPTWTSICSTRLLSLPSVACIDPSCRWDAEYQHRTWAMTALSGPRMKNNSGGGLYADLPIHLDCLCGNLA